jgi:hypothetical protein
LADREEKKRRQAIAREIKRKERAEAEAAMPISKPDLKALFEYVEAELDEKDCDNTLRATREFLSQRQLPEELITNWLIGEGGGCDCEVMANAEETWGEIVGYS